MGRSVAKCEKLPAYWRKLLYYSPFDGASKQQALEVSIPLRSFLSARVVLQASVPLRSFLSARVVLEASVPLRSFLARSTCECSFPTFSHMPYFLGSISSNVLSHAPSTQQNPILGHTNESRIKCRYICKIRNEIHVIFIHFRPEAARPRGGGEGPKVSDFIWARLYILDRSFADFRERHRGESRRRTHLGTSVI